MMRCSNCDALMKEGAKFCGKCGAKAPQAASKCKVCGKEMVGDDAFCPQCGMDRRLVDTQYPPPAPPPSAYAPPPNAQSMYAPPTTVQCGRCGMGVPLGMDRCPYCSHRLKSSRVKDYAGIAGALILIAGLFNVSLYGVASMGASLDLEEFGITAVIFVVLTALNVIALYGAICAIRRKRYLLAVIGSIISMFGLFFFLAIAAIVLLVISKEAFYEEHKDITSGGKRDGYL